MQGIEGGATDKAIGSKVLVQRLEPLRQIHGITIEGVGVAGFTSDGARGYRAGGDTDP